MRRPLTFLVAIIVLVAGGKLAEAADRSDIAGTQSERSASAPEISMNRRLANSQSEAAKAKTKLEKLLGPMKYSDGTSVVRSITVEEDADTFVTGKVAIFVDLRKTEITEELNAGMPPTIDGITIRLRLPGNIVPSYGAHFDASQR